MNLDLPPIDAATFWGVTTTIISAPIIWVWRKIKHLENAYVTRTEFRDGLKALERSNEIRSDAVRNDILRVESTVNLVLSHLLSKKP